MDYAFPSSLNPESIYTPLQYALPAEYPSYYNIYNCSLLQPVPLSFVCSGTVLFLL